MKDTCSNRKVHDKEDVNLITAFSMAKKEIKIITDLSNKKWMSEEEATIYLSIGNPNMFKEWRDHHGLPFYIPNGKKILYKRTDLDAFIERTRCQMPVRR